MELVCPSCWNGDHVDFTKTVHIFVWDTAGHVGRKVANTVVLCLHGRSAYSYNYYTVNTCSPSFLTTQTVPELFCCECALCQVCPASGVMHVNAAILVRIGRLYAQLVVQMPKMIGFTYRVHMLLTAVQLCCRLWRECRLCEVVRSGVCHQRCHLWQRVRAAQSSVRRQGDRVRTRRRVRRGRHRVSFLAVERVQVFSALYLCANPSITGHMGAGEFIHPWLLNAAVYLKFSFTKE